MRLKALIRLPTVINKRTHSIIGVWLPLYSLRTGRSLGRCRQQKADQKHNHNSKINKAFHCFLLKFEKPDWIMVKVFLAQPELLHRQTSSTKPEENAPGL
jgi:hypothetical protein